MPQDNPRFMKANTKLQELGFRPAIDADSNEGESERGAMFSYYIRHPQKNGDPILTAVLMIHKDGGGWKLFVEAGATTINIDDTLDELEEWVHETLSIPDAAP